MSPRHETLVTSDRIERKPPYDPKVESPLRSSSHETAKSRSNIPQREVNKRSTNEIVRHQPHTTPCCLSRRPLRSTDTVSTKSSANRTITNHTQTYNRRRNITTSSEFAHRMKDVREMLRSSQQAASKASHVLATANQAQAVTERANSAPVPTREN